MPKFLERRLRAEGKAKGFSGERLDRYIYGAMNNMGAMHGSKTTKKGERMQAEHARDKAAMGTESHMYSWRSRHNLKRGRSNG